MGAIRYINNGILKPIAAGGLGSVIISPGNENYEIVPRA
jgi:hypothetical protein